MCSNSRLFSTPSLLVSLCSCPVCCMGGEVGGGGGGCNSSWSAHVYCVKSVVRITVLLRVGWYGGEVGSRGVSQDAHCHAWSLQIQHREEQDKRLLPVDLCSPHKQQQHKADHQRRSEPQGICCCIRAQAGQNPHQCTQGCGRRCLHQEPTHVSAHTVILLCTVSAACLHPTNYLSALMATPSVC